MHSALRCVYVGYGNDCPLFLQRLTELALSSLAPHFVIFKGPLLLGLQLGLEEGQLAVWLRLSLS